MPSASWRAEWLRWTLPASVLAVVAARYLAPSAVWLAIAAAVLLFSYAVARRVAADSWLPRLVVAACLLRLILTAAIFWISVGQGHNGILFFSVDSYVYDRVATNISQSWLNHGMVAFIDASVIYPVVLAVCYLLLGPASLHTTLLNSFLGGLAMVLAYRIGNRLSGPRAAVLAAALVGFLPSSVLWSTQLLKETLNLVFTLWAVDLFIGILQERLGAPRELATRGWWQVLKIILPVALLTSLEATIRHYAAFALIGSALLTFGILALACLVRHKPGAACRALLVVPIMVTTLIGGREGERNLRVAFFNEREQHRLGLVPNDQELNRYVFDVHDLPPASNPITALEALAGGLWSYLAKPYHGPVPEVAELLNGPLGDDANLGYAAFPGRLRPSGLLSLAETRRQLAEMFGEFDPETLAVKRRSYAKGHSAIDPGVDISYITGMASYLPKGVLVAYFAPFPWQWFDVGGNTGYFKMAAAVEVVLFYVLLPSIWLGLRELWRRRSLGGMFLVSYVVLVSLPIALIVANLGTLFRLRVMFLAPLLIVAAIGGLPRPYTWAIARVTRRWWPDLDPDRVLGSPRRLDPRAAKPRRQLPAV